MKDIIDSLKIRLNNPFIISFLLSWPLWNWQIAIGLIWYNSDNLQKWTGCDNYFDLVTFYSTGWRSIGAPLLSALVYTFIFPLFKWAISAFNVWISTKEETQILELSKEGNVPTVRFIKALQDSKDKIKELSEIIKNESKLIEENQNLLVEKAKIDSEKKAADLNSKKLSDDLFEKNDYIKWLTFVSDIKSMDGAWTLKITHETLSTSINFTMAQGQVRQQGMNRYFDIWKLSGYLANPLTGISLLRFVIKISTDHPANELTSEERNMITDIEHFFNESQIFRSNFKERSFDHRGPNFTIMLNSNNKNQ